MADAPESIVDALAAFGLRARTEKEQEAIMSVVKEFNVNPMLTRMCERDIPMIMNLAKEKLDHARRMSVRHDGLDEYEAERFMKSMVQIRAENVDVPNVEKEVPDLFQSFRPPCSSVVGPEDLMKLQDRIDVRADEYRLERERETIKLVEPTPPIAMRWVGGPEGQPGKFATAVSPKIDHVVPGQVPELQAYRQMCKTDLPEKPRPFIPPLVPPKLPEYGANYLREHHWEIRRTKSEPQLTKPYPRAPLSTMKVLAHKESAPGLANFGKPIASTRRLPHLARNRGDLPGREYESPVGLTTVPDSMFKQWQQARKIASGRDCLRTHHHFQHSQPKEQLKAADTRRESVKVVRTLKKEEYARMHPPKNPAVMTFVTMPPASVTGGPVSYWDTFPDLLEKERRAEIRGLRADRKSSGEEMEASESSSQSGK